MLPFEHDLVQKVNIEQVRDFDVENIYVKLPNDTGNSCRVYRVHKPAWPWDSLKVQKVTQRSMSNLSEIFM